MSESTPPRPLAQLSFEEALAELEALTRSLEDGRVPLAEAVAAYERGVALQRHCEAKLREAELVVERVMTGADGQPRTEPLP